MEAIVGFCKARHLLKAEEERNRAALEETSDAKKVTADLLRESMLRNGLTHIPLPVDREGGIKYALLVDPPRQYHPFDSTEAILRFADGMGDALPDELPLSCLPAEASRLFLEKARVAPEGKQAEKRLSVVSALPPSVPPLPPAPPAVDLKRATASFSGALQEYSSCRRPLLPYRQAKRAAEKEATPLMEHSDPLRVEMERRGVKRVVAIERAVRKAKKRKLGVRAVSRLVKEAARHAAVRKEADGFDAPFQARLRALADQEFAAPQKETPYLKVRERKAKGAREGGGGKGRAEAVVLEGQ